MIISKSYRLTDTLDLGYRYWMYAYYHCIFEKGGWLKWEKEG
jgi:hypothetical protein